MREIAKRHGIGECPPDHPIYSEPPSAIFINRRGKPAPKQLEAEQAETEESAAPEPKAPRS